MLDKVEVKAVIAAALDKGIFTEFLNQKEQQTEEAIEALLNEIFLDAFIEEEDEMLSE